MSSKLIPSNPSDVMVIRDLTPNVVTLSVPFSRFGLVKVGGRGTIIRLTSGSLAVFSPVALTPEVRAKVDSMGGRVGYIVALDYEHHIFVSEWAQAFPGAQLVGVEGLPEKRANQAASDPRIGREAFSVVFTAASRSTLRVSPEFDADFDYEYVPAHPNKELVFFFRPDRVLVEADLLFNLPATEQYSRVGAGSKEREGEGESEGKPGLAQRVFAAAQATEGDVKWTRRAQWYLFSRGDRASFNESVRRIGAWDFETIVPCHGDTMVGDGKERFERVFEWHLKGEKQ